MILSIIYLSLGGHSEQSLTNVIPTNSEGKLSIWDFFGSKSIKLISKHKHGPAVSEMIIYIQPLEFQNSQTH